MKIYKSFFTVLIFFVTLILSVTEGNSACSPPVQIVGYSYNLTSIQDAYDYASIHLGLSNFTLKLSGEIFTEDIYFDGWGVVELDGGYDCSFSSKISSTGILGSITISAGSATFSDIGIISPTACAFDSDGDGFTSIGSCSGSADDCNDNNPNTFLGATEICDGLDNDCDDQIDEDCTPTCDSSHLELCTTSIECINAGGHWSDNICYGVVISADGRIWMDRNLGASRVATSPTDIEAYGDYYQWGRGADGHQLPTGAITLIMSSNDDPGHGDFILTDTSPFDWRVPQNNNLWQGVSGINNPCPAGFRIPTEAEWETEMVSWSSMDPAGAFASPLKLVLGGYHCHYCGEFYEEGYIGYYWSSKVYYTVNGFYAHYLHLGPTTASTDYDHRAYGHCVRCIQD